MTKNLCKTIILLLPIIATISCNRQNTPVVTGTQTGTLHFGNQTEPEDLDPHIVTGVPEFHILQSLFEGLVIPDPKNLDPLPGAAHSWDISEDRLTYIFHLRNNGRWSNGDTVKASDFVFSSERILSPALGAEYAYMQYCLENAEKFHKGIIQDFTEVGIKAPDDSTLVIKLEKPTPYFLSLIMHHSWYPVHRPTILKHGKIDQRGTKWTRVGNLTGNGQFTLNNWQINKIITVKRNKYYWDNEKVKLNEINFYPIDNNQTEERAFRTGQLHLTANLPLQKINWYKTNNPEVLHIDPNLGTYYYLVNVTRKNLDNKKIRKALSLAIERDTLVKHVLKGGQSPAVSFTPPNTAGYTYGNELRFDPVEAKKLLKEAGYDSITPLPPISLLYNTSESHHTIAQAIQQMWKKHLGVEVTLVNQEWKVYLSSTQSKDYDLARMGWISDYNDPNSFLDMWITGGGNNRTGWTNPSYDSLIDAASKSWDQNTRYSLLKEAESILLDELPIIPVYFYTNVYLLHKSVKGWYPNILNIHNFKFVYLE